MGNDSERGLMARLASVRSRLPTKWKRTLQYVRVKHHMKHVHGPAKLELGDDEAVVTCLVKNGSFYLPRFVDHYRRLGFRHIFFLDNGSTDTSVEEMASYDDVSVYRCDLPIGDHQTLMKRALARTVAPHGWCLDVDIDEFFDYPNRDAIDLTGFLRYLNSRDFTLVVAQMLDMFADGPISRPRAGRRDMDLGRPVPLLRSLGGHPNRLLEF